MQLQELGQLHGLLVSLAGEPLRAAVQALGLTPQDMETLRARRVRLTARLPDPVNDGAFILGEVLASECVLRRDGREALLLRVGDDLAAARDGAVLLLAVTCGDIACVDVEAQLRPATQARQARRGQEAAAVAATRVRFEGGEVEAYDTTDFSTDR